MQNLASDELIKDLDLPMPGSEALSTVEDYSIKVGSRMTDCVCVTCDITWFPGLVVRPGTLHFENVEISSVAVASSHWVGSSIKSSCLNGSAKKS